MSTRFSTRSLFDTLRSIVSDKRPRAVVSRRRPHTVEVLEARIAPAAALAATKVAVFAPGGDVNGDGKFQPGDTILYTVTITNTGDVDLTGVTFNDLIDPNTNLGAVNVSPLALDDTFTAVANTLLEVGVTHGAFPAAQTAGSVVGNDVEFLGDTFTLSKLEAVSFSGGTATATSGQGGTVTMNAAGNFTYLPAAGFSGTDTFHYTITDKGLDGIAGNADDLTSVGTVKITVGAQKVWYVDNSYNPGVSGPSDGRSTHPFVSITATNLNGAGGAGDVDGAGDIIYIHRGTGAAYTGGIALEGNQTLHGQGEILQVGGFTLNAAGTAPLLTNVGGTTVALSNTTVMPSNVNSIKGVTLGDSSIDISGSSFGTLNVTNTVSLNGTGKALDLTTGTISATLADLTVTSSGTQGISLTGVGGTLTANTGSLAGITGDDIFISGGTANITLGISDTNTAGHSVNIASNTGGTVNLNGSINDTGTGILLSSNSGETIHFTGGITASTGVNKAFSATGGGTIDVTGANNTLTTGAATALEVDHTNISSTNLTFKSISANGAAKGIILDLTDVGGLLVTGTGTTAGTGGTIQNTTTRGIEMIGTAALATQSFISLKNMNFTNNATTVEDTTTVDAGPTGASGANAGVSAAIHLNNVNGATFDNIVINGSGQNGINGLNVVDLKILNSTVQNCGNESGESGVFIQNLTGLNCAVTNSTFSNNNVQQFGFVNYTSGALGTAGSPFTVTGSTFTGKGNAVTPGGDGFQGRIGGTSTGFINVSGSHFTKNYSYGVFLDAVSSGNATFNVTGSDFGAGGAANYNNSGIATGISGSAVVNYTFSTNTITGVAFGTPGNGVGIIATTGLTTAGASIIGTISGNTIGETAVAGSGGFNNAAAMQLLANGGGPMIFKATVSGNFIHNTTSFGIQYIGGTTTGAVTGTVNINGNTLDGGSPNAQAISVAAAASGAGGAVSTLGANIGNLSPNTITGSWDGPNGDSIRVTTLRGSQFTVGGLPSNPNATPAQVVAYLATVNNVTGGNGNALITASNTASGGGTFIGTGAAAPLLFQPTQTDVVTAPVVHPAAGGGSAPVAPPPIVQTPVAGGGTTTVQPPVIVDDGVLSQGELDSLVGAAIARWEATGLTPVQDAILHHVTFSVQDLPGWYLGEATPGHVTLDLNAAGNSWFIDPTPNDDSEFSASHATATGGATGRIDALTTVMHELGHQLGLDDSYVSSDSGNLMYGYIHQSERRLPTAHQADGATPHLANQAGPDFAVGPINIGSLPVGKSVQVVFDAQIVANPSASTISNQGTASSTQTGPVQTDGDAVTPGQQPTITQIALPEVNLSIGTTTSVAEDSGGNLVYTFTRQAPLTNSLTVNFTVSGGAVFTGNAASDTDYTQSGAASFSGTTGTVTFAANSNTATVTITPHADTVTEPDETVVLTVASGTGYSVASTGSISGTGTILNDDTTVFVTGTPGSVAEDSGNHLTYTFKRNGLIANALDVHLHLAGSATFPTDYGQAGATTYDGTDAFLHFAPGSDTATIVLTPVSDSTVEPDETVQMTLVAGAGYTVDSELNSLTGTITNDDATVSVAIQAPGSIAEDAPGVLTYTFTRTGFIANAATVNFTASGSATKDVDYGVNGASFVGLAGTVTFAPNSSTATVLVDPTADANGEPDETVIFTINAGTGYSPDVSPNEHATGTILNDDTSVSVAVSGSPISEAATGGAHLTYTFTRSGDNSTPLTINFSAGGSASFANDYVLTGANSFSTASGLGTLTFPANSSTATVSLIPTNDTLVEGDEQAALFVNTGPGYGVGASPAIGTITDNESATISFVSLASNAPEQITPHSVDVHLVTFSPEGTASLQNDFTVYVQDHGGSGAAPATGGGVDYTFNEQSITFSAGDTGSTKTVNVTIINDTLSEGSEMFQLGLSATSAAPPPFVGVPTTAVTVDTAPHTVTIVDNDVDVHVTANGAGGSVIAGSGANNFSVTFSVQNTGLTDATNLNLSELFTLPTGVTFSSAVGGAGDTIVLTDTGGTWIIPALAAQTGADTLTVNFTADHSTAGGASASVMSTASSADQVLVNTGDDSAMQSGSFARQSDLHLTKTDSPDPVGPGGQLTYTITVHNNGPSDATLATVTDLLPSADYSNATWTTTLNGAPGAGGSGDVNASSAIPAQGDFVVTVVGTVTAPSNSSFSNTASVNSSEETNFMDNQDMASTFVGGVDLKLTKQADLALITPSITGNDHILTYTLTYRNGGFITANGVNINDLIPANTTFDSAHSNPGWLDAMDNPVANHAAAGTAIHFPVGSLPVSDTGASITLAVKVNPTVTAGASTIDNAADISDDGTGGADLAPGDNHATASSTLAAAPDLHLTQTADKLLIIRGQTLHVSYTYSNDGNQDASGATIVAHVPTGTTFDLGQSTAGWSDSGMGNFTLDLGTVAAGGGMTTVIFAVNLNTTRVAGLHEVDTTAKIDDDHNNGVDPTMANNTAASTATKIYEGIYAVSQGIAVAGKFGTPTVHVYDPIDGHEMYHFDAYESKLRASVRVAVADINGDGFDDIITTIGTGTGRLRVFDGLTGTWLHDELSYSGPFKNEIAVFNGKTDKGAFVAAGDLTGDGHAEIVVGSALGGSKVRVLDGSSGVAETFGPSNTDYFQPFGKTFKGGVRVAVGDVLGSSRADLAVAMGFYGSEVKVYDGTQFGGFKFLAAAVPPPPGPVAALDFKVGPASYKGGLSIALGDLNNDGKLDIITGRNFYKPTLVESFSGLLKDGNGNPQMLGAAIDPFDKNPAKPTYALGVRVAAIDVDFDGIADIIAATGGNNKSTANIYSGADHHLIRTFTAIPQTPNSSLFTAGTAVSPVVRFA